MLERTFADLAAAGVRWVRVDLRWYLVEPHGPSVASGRGDWSEMDAIVRAADRHGLQLLPIVGYSPAWTTDEDEHWAYPDAAPFETFFAAALRRYPQITAWELWNEPNFGVFAKPHPDPAGFVGLLRSAARVRAQVSSSARLISGGLAPGVEIDIIDWVDEMARLGGLELIDGLGVHPYSAVAPDEPRAWMMRLERLHERLAFLGRPDLPLWLTEYGAPASAAAERLGAGADRGGAGPAPASGLRPGHPPALRREPDLVRVPRQLRRRRGRRLSVRSRARRPVAPPGLPRTARSDRGREDHPAPATWRSDRGSARRARASRTAGDGQGHAAAARLSRARGRASLSVC